MLEYELISTRKVLIKSVIISHVFSSSFNQDKSNLNTYWKQNNQTNIQVKNIVAYIWGLFYVLYFSWQQRLGMLLPCIVIVWLSYQTGIFPESYFPICYSWLKSLHPIRWSFAILPKTSVWACFFFKFSPNLCTCIIVYIDGLLCGRPVIDGSFYLCPSRFPFKLGLLCSHLLG